MAKLKSVKDGWRLDAVMKVSVAPANFFMGKLPYFEATGTKPGGWRGGENWLSSPTPLPWGLPGVV